MRTKDVPYSEFVKRHPNEVRELQEKIKVAPRGYTRKCVPIRDLPFPDAFRFSYEYGVSALNPDLQTVDERVEQHLSAIGSVNVSIRADGSQREFWKRLPDGYYPPELVNHVREYEIREQNERDRRNRLTPEQRRQETENTLRELSGSSGFFGVHVNLDGSTEISNQGETIHVPPPQEQINNLMNYEATNPNQAGFLNKIQRSMGLPETHAIPHPGANMNATEASGKPVEKKKYDRFADIM